MGDIELAVQLEQRLNQFPGRDRFAEYFYEPDGVMEHDLHIIGLLTNGNDFFPRYVRNFGEGNIYLMSVCFLRSKSGRPVMSNPVESFTGWSGGPL